MKFNLGLAQVSTSEEKQQNLDRGIELVRQASDAGVDVLVLPELFMAYATLDEPYQRFLDIAEKVDGPFVSSLAKEVRKAGMYLVVGILERPTGLRSRKVHNTAVMLGPDGRVIATHRKIQQFDSFGYEESSRFEPGTEVEGTFKTKFGKFGLMTCYELRFPEIARVLSMEGAELIIVPTAWLAGRMKEDHLHILARARALENTVFVAVASQTGRIFSGRSIVVDPFGVPICDAGEGEGLTIAQIDTGRIAQVRKVLPNLGQVKMDIYSKHWRTKL